VKERNTKQKEIILSYLLNTKSHPSIYELEKMIKKDHPKIGTATIYRNISKMVDAGIIRKITTIDGIIHYDGDISPHIHLCCASCNKLIDIFNKKVDDAVRSLEKVTNVKIFNYELLISGTCETCQENK